jgi:tripartite-type tricarboxylate transporter receptor subunit TctC
MTPTPRRGWCNIAGPRLDVRRPGGKTMPLAPALLLAILFASGPALAQPSQKPIRIIVPFAPGASADGIARAIGNDLGVRMNKTVVVENSVGAGGSSGLVQLAKAPPDGDTLGVGATGALLINPILPNSTAPDLLRELAPVAKLIEVGIVVVANPTTGPKSIKELIEWAKTRPQGVSYGSTGVHSGQHLTMEMLKVVTGANLVHIPYRGSAPAVVDLIAGQIPVAAVDITSAYPHIVAGKLIALGMGETKRSVAAPEIPTIAEGGVAGFGRAGGFIGLFAPANTPPAIVKRISGEVREILKTPQVQANVRNLTVSVAYEDDAAFASFLNTEAARWKQTLQALGLAK